MQLFGITTNPIIFCKKLNEQKIRYSLNSIVIFKRLVIFSSLRHMYTRINSLKRKTVVVFDSEERLNNVKGITIINKSNYNLLAKAIKNPVLGSLEPVKIIKYNPIAVAIDLNKNVGLLHKYNTSLYSISVKDLRESIRLLILDFASGKETSMFVNQSIELLVKGKKGPKLKSTITDILNLVNSEEFGRIRASVIELLKNKKVVDRIIVESVSLKNKVEPFDVHYLYSVILKMQLNTSK